MSSLQNQAKTKQAASGIAYPICCFPCATPSYSFLITAMSQNTQNKASTGGAPPAATANAPTLSESGNAEPTEQQKTPKPSAAEVTNKVLAIIMVSEPLTLADMCKQLQELPRDSIQAVLEVLQVLGLVVQLSTTKEVAGTKPNSSNNMTYVYALTEFAKFSTAFPITQAESEIKSMQAKTRDVRSRIEELQVQCVWCNMNTFVHANLCVVCSRIC